MTDGLKLIMNCRKNDKLYYVSVPKYSNDKLIIKKIWIESIKHNTYTPDIYTCRQLSSDKKIKFSHISSSHDSLVLDTDYGYVDDDCNARVYTTYQGALNWGIQQIQSSILNSLKQLELAEKRYGLSDRYFFEKKTKSYMDNEVYRIQKKYEIYDTMYIYKETPEELDKKLNQHPIEVWKHYVEYNAHGYDSGNHYIPEDRLVEKFDTIEDARKWIHENDKSRHEGENEIFFEGYKYYIKGID